VRVLNSLFAIIVRLGYGATFLTAPASRRQTGVVRFLGGITPARLRDYGVS
jgi:hypothetical protein